MVSARAQHADKRHKLPVSLRVMLGVGSTIAWAALVLGAADPIFGPLALLSSVVSFAAMIFFFTWSAPQERVQFKVVGLVVSVQTFMFGGVSILNEVEPERFIVKPTSASFDFAVASVVVFAGCFLVALWLTMTKTASPTPAAERERASGPTSTTTWIIAILTSGLALAAASGVLRNIGVLPTVALSPALIIPLVAARGLSRKVSRVPLLILLASQVFLTLQTTLLGHAANAVRDVLLTFVMLRKRLPYGILAATVVAFIVFNPAKAIVREELYGRGSITFERSVELWGEALEQTWSTQTLARQDRRDAAVRTTRARLDYNWISAHVFTAVPDRMPFKLGRTYEDVPMLLVPRIIYPDKPTSDQYTRSRWLIEIGAQDPRSVDTVAISLPAAAEAYWNFGWLGVFVVPLALGAIVGLILRIHIDDSLGRAAWTVLVATTCTIFVDLLVWIVPQLVIALISAAVVTFLCRVGRTKLIRPRRGPEPMPTALPAMQPDR